MDLCVEFVCVFVHELLCVNFGVDLCVNDRMNYVRGFVCGLCAWTSVGFL